MGAERHQCKVVHKNRDADYALRSWRLGFGRFVRVLAPSGLADWIQEELDQARQQYAGNDNARVADSDIQPGLPFLFNQLVNA